MKYFACIFFISYNVKSLFIFISIKYNALKHYRYLLLSIKIDITYYTLSGVPTGCSASRISISLLSYPSSHAPPFLFLLSSFAPLLSESTSFSSNSRTLILTTFSATSLVHIKLLFFQFF